MMKGVRISFQSYGSCLMILENEYPDVIHSLDVWHKSKSIKKCLAKVCILLPCGVMARFLLETQK